MRNLFKKYKKALPFVIATAVIGSAVMSCIALGIVGAVV